MSIFILLNQWSIIKISMNKSIFYNKFHKSSKPSISIPLKNDFTYKSLITLTDKYLIGSKKIADIGCGVGLLDFYLAKKGHLVDGFDISEKAISVAINSAKIIKQKNLPKFKVLNFPKEIISKTYDLVICSEVLEHLKNDVLAVKNIHKLIKKDGLIMASAPSLNAPLFKIGVLNKFDHRVGHLRRYSYTTFINLFKNSKFKIVEVIKTEGIIRNFLFTNNFGGLLLKFIKFWPISDIVTQIDRLTIPIFGESNIYIVARKV